MKKVFKKVFLVVLAVAVVSALITAQEVLKKKNLQLQSEIDIQKRMLAEMKDKQRNMTPENILEINEHRLQTIKRNIMQIRVDDYKYPDLSKQLKILQRDATGLEGKVKLCKEKPDKKACGEEIESKLEILARNWVDFLKNASDAVRKVHNKDEARLHAR